MARSAPELVANRRTGDGPHQGPGTGCGVLNGHGRLGAGLARHSDLLVHRGAGDHLSDFLGLRQARACQQEGGYPGFHDGYLLHTAYVTSLWMSLAVEQRLKMAGT
jgi:hypothetical protein